MIPSEQSKFTRQICQLAPVVPVLVVEHISHAKELAQALIGGGLRVLEVTLRTSCALDAIRVMAEVDGGVVGAGTLLSAQDVKAAKQAGAKFGVSPGATAALIDACGEYDLPLLPGAVSASEMMVLLEQGYDMLKFFPAEQSGGAAFLKSIGGPLPQISFCPTGGIGPESAKNYLSLNNVSCVGGSWVAPKKEITAGNWHIVTELAREATTFV